MYPARITMIDYARPLAERAKRRTLCGPYTWTPVERCLPNGRNAPFNGRGFYQASKGLQMDARGSSFDLRLDYANTHAPYQRRGAGPFTSENGQDYTAIIARLPHGRGYLAGWTMGNGMCASLDGHVWTDIEDAARAAIDEARQAAEDDVWLSEEEENEDA